MIVSNYLQDASNKQFEESKMQNRVVWFDIPVTDLARAKAFYEKVFDVQMIDNNMGDHKMTMFPFEPNVASGALVEGPDYTPSKEGTVIYLNGGDDLAVPLSKVEEAGGTVLQDKTSIGEYGFIAYFFDTEGNKIALHSMG